MARATLKSITPRNQLPDVEITLVLNRKEALAIRAITGFIHSPGTGQGTAYEHTYAIYEALDPFEKSLSKVPIYQMKLFEGFKALPHDEFAD